ncbi:phosphodiester glycosidase family protein [Candidatus Micrarchaeota archaeon]|nr:phosphodiester glycosidase family protein [Candidatus Micrarchaeota archaeon]
MYLEKQGDLAIIKDINPLYFRLYNLLPNGKYVIEEAEKLNLRLGINNVFFEYYKPLNKFTITGRVIYRGKVIEPVPLVKDWAYTFFILNNKDIKLRKYNEIIPRRRSQIHLAIEAGPRLIVDENITEGLNNTFRSSKICIGWDKNQRIMVAATEGKVSLNEFAEQIQDQGFIYALNLDGGGSTSLYYNENGVKLRIIGKSSYGYDKIKFEQNEYGRKVPYMVGIPKFIDK